MGANDAEHHLKLAPRMEDTLHSPQHEGFHDLIVQIGYLSAQEVMQHVADPFLSIPLKGIQKIPHRMKSQPIADDGQGMVNVLLTAQIIETFQIQIEKTHICIGDLRATAFPAQFLHDGLVLREFVPPEGSGQHRIIFKYSHAILLALVRFSLVIGSQHFFDAPDLLKHLGWHVVPVSYQEFQPPLRSISSFLQADRCCIPSAHSVDTRSCLCYAEPL